MKGTLFLNPASGGRRDLAGAVADAARAKDLEVILVDRELPIVTMVRERIDRGIRTFVAAGGDGTIHHVAQAIVSTNATLGVVPVGTLNHFARDIGVPLDWASALDVALTGEQRQIDVGRINNIFFINNISLGLYPPFVEHREGLRHYGKWRAFPYAAYQTFKYFPHVSLAFETPHRLEAVKTHVFMVSNNMYDFDRVGLAAPRKTLEGGRLGVYWIPHMPKMQFIALIARYLRGKVHGMGGYQFMQTTQLKVRTSQKSLRVGIDGELTDLETPLDLMTFPASLLVRVPR